MTRISQDCFAVGEGLMTVEEALALISERVAPVAETASVPLDQADGRILAEAVTAQEDVPRFDNAAVDGYAVRFADLSTQGGTTLPLGGRITAGADPLAPLQRTAIRVFTGAPLPPGADTVFMQEDVRAEGDRVTLPAGLRAGANRRRRGEDMAAGATILHPGARLDPRVLAAAAAAGRAELLVRRPLRVAVFSTGNEVSPPGAPLAGSRIYDANRPMLSAMLRRLGCIVEDKGIVPDDRAGLAAILTQTAPQHDLLVTSGGVSVGEEDHVRAAIASLGAISFWRLAIKPGRPVAMGIVGATPLIGLPGNPLAAFVTFALVGRALVARLSGEDHRPPLALPVRAAFGHEKKQGLREYLRVRLVQGPDGQVLEKHPKAGAAMISSLVETEGLAQLPEGTTRLSPGDAVAFVPYAALL